MKSSFDREYNRTRNMISVLFGLIIVVWVIFFASFMFLSYNLIVNSNTISQEIGRTIGEGVKSYRDAVK